QKIITECWIWDQQMFIILNDFIKQFEDVTRSQNWTQPDGVDLLLEVTVEDGKNWCGYYYVSASTRSLFWLETCDLSRHMSGVRGEVSPTHIKLFLESQYWSITVTLRRHWDLFPNVNKATNAIYDLVANTIADARTGVQSSRTSPINQSKEDLKEMAEIVEGMRKASLDSLEFLVIINKKILGRFMYLLVTDQYLNYHGQFGARLNSLQSIHVKKVLKQTWLFRIFNLLLFSAPNIHLKTLNELWVDELTLRPQWVNFFIKMNGQWRGHIKIASILLAADVAFLSIPSIDPSNNMSNLRSTRNAAQIASYLSVITSFASMLLGLMLVRQHQAKGYERLDVKVYHDYLHIHVASKWGFEGLAIAYSLPYALLTWGMAAFLVGFLLLCFVKSTAIVRSIVAIPSALICGLIVWCIWMFWEETDYHWLESFHNVWNRLTGKHEGSGDSSALVQEGETESRQDDAAANSDGTVFGHDAGSLEQDVGQRSKHMLLFWLTRAKSWWGDARLTGENNIPLSQP
ncbi:hypothetical protein J132_10283, partial [Termitomyces sp. J132]